MLRTPEPLSSTPIGNWQTFIHSFWERRPVVFRHPGGVLELSESAILGIVRQSAHSTQIKNVRVIVGQNAPLNGLERFGPTPEEQSFEAYLSRLSELNRDDVTVIVNEAQVFDFSLWAVVRNAFRGLFGLVGLPIRSDLVIYASCSATTAFGIHVDPYSNFLFQLSGEKRFRLWSRAELSRFPDRKNSHTYSEIENEGYAFDLKPGDLMYIPSDFYHIAETPRRPSAHLSVLLAVKARSYAEMVSRIAITEVDRRSAKLCIAPFRNSHHSVADDASLIASVYGGLESSLHSALNLELIRLRSAFGCILSPGLLTPEAVVTAANHVQLNHCADFLVEPFHGAIHVACNGYAGSYEDSPQIREVIRLLKSGDRVSILDFVTASDASTEVCTTKISRCASTFSLIKMLTAARGLEIVCET